MPRRDGGTKQFGRTRNQRRRRGQDKESRKALRAQKEKREPQ